MSQSSLNATSARNELYELMKADLPFKQKAERALELGQQYLGVENGHLTRIHRNPGHWEAIVSTDPPDGSFPPGLILDLETTYCRRTLEADSPIALHDAPNQDWADDPAYEAHGLHCYHGTTLTVDDEPYGTVCFVSETPHDQPFSDEETMFAELIGRLLEHELDRTRHESELDRRATLINVLNRVLRHNLRNDMTVVQGRLQQIMARNEIDDEVASPLFEKLDKLLELSETARQLDSILGTDSTRKPTDLVTLTQRVAADVEADFPEGAVAVQNDGETVFADVMPSLSTAVRELIENGVKHSESAEPTVTVTVKQLSEAVSIQISDDGPGLPEQERRVLRRGSETALEHGSGLGLWVVHWIVIGHDGRIEMAVSDDGTDITITLMRTDVVTDGVEPDG